MLTIHCYVCGADERLRGEFGGPDSPLFQFMRLHPHSKGTERVRLICPCGSVYEIVSSSAAPEVVAEGVERHVSWYKEHEAHIKAADSNGGAVPDSWTEWL